MDDFNPTDHDLAATVRRYLGIKMEKTITKLGGSDWGRRDLSPEHTYYMREDVGHLPPLWEALDAELKEAKLDHVFRERMEFFPHLNQIKMIGNPIDPLLCEADHKNVTAEKDSVREELRGMFADYRAPIPKSRLKKTIKIQAEAGKFKRVPGPSEEEFSASSRDHVIGALAHHGIYVDNVQEATLRKIDSPECRLLLKYGTAKKRLNAIKAIVRSTFPDGRVRARGWNQLAARTGRIISSEPNPQMRFARKDCKDTGPACRRRTKTGTPRRNGSSPRTIVVRGVPEASRAWIAAYSSNPARSAGRTATHAKIFDPLKRKSVARTASTSAQKKLPAARLRSPKLVSFSSGPEAGFKLPSGAAVFMFALGGLKEYAPMILKLG
jgi:hypothetical protein